MLVLPCTSGCSEDHASERQAKSIISVPRESNSKRTPKEVQEFQPASQSGPERYVQKALVCQFIEWCDLAQMIQA